MGVAPQPDQDHHEHVVLGMSAAMGAFLMFTVMNVFAKLLSANHSVVEIAFYRNLIASVPFLVAAFAFGQARDHYERALALWDTVEDADELAAYDPDADRIPVYVSGFVDPQQPTNFAVAVNGTISYRGVRQRLNEPSEVHFVPALSGG